MYFPVRISPNFQPPFPLLSVEPVLRFSQGGGTWLRSFTIAQILKGYWSIDAAPPQTTWWTRASTPPPLWGRLSWPPTWKIGGAGACTSAVKSARRVFLWRFRPRVDNTTYKAR